MSPAAVRKLAAGHELDRLHEGAEAIAEREEDVLGVDGDDLGEKLTHVMLAIRVRTRMADEGVDLKTAFRDEMSKVRDLLTNE